MSDQVSYEEACIHIESGGKAYRQGWYRGPDLFIENDLDEDGNVQTVIDSMSTPDPLDRKLRIKYKPSKRDVATQDWVLI